MSNKPSLLVYSDCYIYGGSERLMSFLIRNPLILEEYRITFAYRKHKDYETGINNDLNDQEKIEFLRPVRIISNATLFYKINLKGYPVIFKKIIKIPFFLLDKIGVYFIFNIISHVNTLQKVSPDIIHINNGGYPAARSCNTMVVAAKILGFKNIIYQINNVAQKRTCVFNLLYDRFINGSVSCFITASQQAKDKLVKERKFSTYKIKHLPNTVQEEFPTLSRNELFTELAIKQNDFVLCTVAFLSKRKGQQFLLEALYKVSINHFDIFDKIQLIIVGNGEEEKNLKQYVKEYKLGEHVLFVGYQKKSIDFISACDVFILPSITNEDMPLVVLTAMSKGKTIISTDFAGIREQIENGISGILISNNTDTIANELASKIIYLYKNRNNLLGEEAKIRYNALFSTQVYGHSIVKLYNSIIEKNGVK